MSGRLTFQRVRPIPAALLLALAARSSFAGTCTAPPIYATSGKPCAKADVTKECGPCSEVILILPQGEARHADYYSIERCEADEVTHQDIPGTCQWVGTNSRRVWNVATGAYDLNPQPSYWIPEWENPLPREGVLYNRRFRPQWWTAPRVPDAAARSLSAITRTAPVCSWTYPSPQKTCNSVGE